MSKTDSNYLPDSRMKDAETYFQCFNTAIHDVGYLNFEFQTFHPIFKDAKYVLIIPIKIFYSTKNEFEEFCMKVKHRFNEVLPETVHGEMIVKCTSHYNFEITLIVE